MLIFVDLYGKASLIRNIGKFYHYDIPYFVDDKFEEE